MNKVITFVMSSEIETSLLDINCAQSVLSLFLDSMGSDAYTDDDRNMIYSAIKLINPAIDKLTHVMEEL